MDGSEGLTFNARGGLALKGPKQNRVTPFGTIEATPHKGGLMGNRGDLHAPDGTLGRQWRSCRWLTCVLDGNGWKAPMDTPGHYYPLFFHDEAVALSAGHRPCGECRPEALATFIAAWKSGHNFAARDWVPLREIDRACHRARVDERSSRRSALLAEIPEGAFVFSAKIDHRPLLVFADHLWPWEHGGYDKPIVSPCQSGHCIVLTPMPAIAALRAGYSPIMAEDLQRVAADRRRS